MIIIKMFEIILKVYEIKAIKCIHTDAHKFVYIFVVHKSLLFLRK